MNHVCPLTEARTLSTQTSACYRKGLSKLFVDCWKYECQNVLLFSEDLFSILCEDNILNTLQEPDQSVFCVGLRKLAQKAEWVWWSVPITSSSLTQATQWPPKPRHVHCLSTHTHTHTPANLISRFKWWRGVSTALLIFPHLFPFSFLGFCREFALDI